MPPAHLAGLSAISDIQNLLVVNSTFHLDQRNTTTNQRQPSANGESYHIILRRRITYNQSDLRQVADWLTPINFRVIQSDTFSKHTLGTGTWFIDHPQFQKWLSGNNQVLWIEGMRKYLTYTRISKNFNLQNSWFWKDSSRVSFYSLQLPQSLSIPLCLARSLLNTFKLISLMIMALLWSLRIADIWIDILYHISLLHLSNN